MDKREILQILNDAYFSKNMQDKKIMAHLPELLSNVKLFVDIGASLGQYTFLANKTMTNGKIYAIEPDPLRFEKLLLDCKKWESSSTNEIKCIHAAASYCDEKNSFFVTNSNFSGGLFKHGFSAKEQESAARVVGWEQIEVKCLSLDNLFLFKEEIVPDFIKIDVEGSELRVLKGCLKMLKSGSPIFLIEVHNYNDPKGQKNATEFCLFMKNQGYKYYDCFGEGKTLFFRHIYQLSYKLFLKIQIHRIVYLVKKVIKKMKKALKKILSIGHSIS